MSSVIPAPRRRFRSSLARNMLVVLLLLSILPLLLVGSTAFWRARSLLSEQIYRVLAAVAESQGQQVASEVATSEALLSRAIHQPEISSALSSALAVEDRRSLEFSNARSLLLDDLQSVNHPTTRYSQFLVVLPDGAIHLASRRDWQGLHLSLPSPNMIKGVSSLALFGLDPLYTDTFIVLTTIPFTPAGEHQPQAVIAAVAEPHGLRGILESSLFFSSNQYFITRQGQFIGMSSFPESIEKWVLVPPSEEQQNWLGGSLPEAEQPQVREIPSFYGEPVIAAYTWLPTLEVGWVAEVTQESVYRQVNSLLVFGAVLFLTVTMATGAVFAYATQRLLRPMVDLSETVRSFAEGNWEQRAPVERSDEVGLLAHSFNSMADELTQMYHSLESQVEQRTREVRTSAEAAQLAVSTPTADELVRAVVELAAERFHLPYAALYLVDDSGEYAVLQHQAGNASPELLGKKRVRIEAESLVGWVITFNRQRRDAVPGGLQARTGDWIVDAKVHAGVPIAVGDYVLGMLEAQTQSEDDLSEATMAVLQNLTNQVAPALRLYALLESMQIDLGQANMLFRTSRRFSQAETEAEVLDITRSLLKETPYSAVLMTVEAGALRPILSTAPTGISAPQQIEEIYLGEEEQRRVFASTRAVLLDSRNFELPAHLLDLPNKMGCKTAAIIPVLRGNTVVLALVIGAGQTGRRDEARLTTGVLGPYTTLAEMIYSSLQSAHLIEEMNRSLAELQIVDAVSKAISMETDIEALAGVIHEELEKILGKSNFFLAVMDRETQMISIPYMTEGSERIVLDPFPVGEGLTSILLRTHKPLLLSEDAEVEGLRLGAKLVGSVAKSWLGVPLLVAGESIGAMVVQDLEQAGRYTEAHKRLLVTLAAQVAVAVRNVQLLESARRRAEHERMLFEITTRIQRSPGIEAILQTTVEELGKALHVKSAEIEVGLPSESSRTQPTTGGNGSHLHQDATGE